MDRHRTHPPTATSTTGTSWTATKPRCRTRRTRRQPDGVHALSRTFDPGAHSWQEDGWQGRELQGAVIYELHLGTFTPEGTLDAAAGKLDYLAGLGVDFIELLPVNAFNGTHNWGYDGVQWFAVHEALRRPGSVPAVRRRRPRGGPRRDPGRGLQPPRPQRELPAAVRALPQARRGQHVGRLRQPGRARLRPCPPVHPGQRGHVAARLPR